MKHPWEKYVIIFEYENSSNVSFRRAIFVLQNMKQGDDFTMENMRSIQLEYTLVPKYLPHVLGHKTTINFEWETLMEWS